MAKETVTIYIDDSAIRLLIAKGRSIQSWGDMPLEPGLVKDGVILDQDAVTEKLRELWQIAGKRKSYYLVAPSGELVQVTQVGKPGKVIAGINGVNCLHRLLTLPELPKDLLPEAVKREAGRVLGVPLAGLYLFWQVLPPLKKGETSVYLVALPRDAVDSLVSTLRKAGFKPYLMDLKPLAIARTITQLNAIVVDVQPGSLDVVIMIDRIPQVVRSIPLPPETSLEDRMPVIGEELSRAILFYNSSHMDKPIAADVPLLLSGELAESEDMWSLLHEPQRPVKVLPSPMEAPEGFPHSQYLTNIGLALKEVLAAEKEAIPYSLVDFNALPEVYLPRRRPLSEVIYIAVSIIGIALIAWLATSNIISSGRIDDLSSELTVINLDIDELNQDISDLNHEISKLESWISKVQEHHNTLNLRIGELNEDIAILMMLNTTIGVDVSSIGQEMTSLNGDMVQLNEHMQELLINISAVQADVAAINQGLIILEQQEIEQLSQDIENLEGWLWIIEIDLADINQGIDDLNQDIEQMKEKVPLDYVPLLVYNMDPINEAIDLLYGDIEGMRDCIASIQTQIDSVTIALSALDTAIGFADIRDEVNGDLEVIINFTYHRMPADVFEVKLKTIDHGINRVTVTGSAVHEVDISDYAKYLRAQVREEDGSKRFALVVVTSITGEEGVLLDFTLELIK